ncbi:MAG: hypothetical protein LBS99_00560 [Clostridiales bacterium]|jgi:hypothetical protein|nr:hypothetical protein [Clostridiales bacterium]
MMTKQKILNKRIAFVLLAALIAATGALGLHFTLRGSVNADSAVIGDLYSVSGKNSSVSYGRYPSTPNTAGVQVHLGKGDKFVYNKIINVNALSATDSLLRFYVTPNNIGTPDADKITVTLTDVHDADNYITTTVKKVAAAVPGAAWAERNTYITAGANGQYQVGLEKSSATTNVNYIVFDGAGYLYHRNDMYGAGVTYSLPGWPDYEDISAPNIDASVLDTQIMSLQLDYAQKAMYAATTKTARSIITDFDSEALYDSDLWQGFTTGEFNISIGGANYNADSLNIVITDLVGSTAAELESNLLIDAEGPVISIDFDGYEESGLPNAVAGRPYRLFSATARDVYDGACAVVCKVYDASNNEIAVANGAFVPPTAGNYTLEYAGSDKSHNVTTERVTVAALASTAAGLGITLNKSAANESGAVGKPIPVAAFSLQNAIGRTAVNIEAVGVSNGVRYEIDADALTFRPMYSGGYTVTYNYEDYVYSLTESYAVAVADSAEPVILQDILLPKYFVRYCGYNMPAVTGYKFVNGAPVETAAELTVAEQGKTTTVTDGYFTPTKAGSATVTYSVSGGAYVCKKSVEIPIVNVGYGGTLKIGDYFYTSQFTYGATKNYIDFNAVSGAVTGGTASMEFVNKLPAFAFSTSFTAVPGSTDYDKINIWLTDSVDASIRVKISFVKTSSGITTVILNDDVATATPVSVGFSNAATPFTLDYDGVKSFTVQSSKTLTAGKTADGKVFNGFGSSYVYMTVEASGIAGDAGVRMVKLCKQSITNASGDYMEPIYFVNTSAGNRAINAEFTIPAVYAADVLDPHITFYLTVTAPDGGIVAAKDGVVLKETDPTRAYGIVLGQYGSYRISYYAADSMDTDEPNVSSVTYVLTVVDTESPTVLILNHVTRARVGEKIEIAKLHVQDNASTRFSLFVAVQLPNGEYAAMTYTVTDGETFESTEVTAGSFTASAAGIYTVTYLVRDEADNFTVVSYGITVE